MKKEETDIRQLFGSLQFKEQQDFLVYCQEILDKKQSRYVKTFEDAVAILGNDNQAVIECDAIYLDHDWQSSKGCNLEYRAAKIYDKEIYEHDKL